MAALTPAKGGAALKVSEASTTMGTWESYVPANAVDGREDTFYWSNSAPQPGSYFQLDLGSEQELVWCMSARAVVLRKLAT